MTLLLSHDDVQASVSMADAIEAMETAFLEEGSGRTTLPQRINMKAGKGWLRVGPVAMEGLGWGGFKAMNLAPGHGVRYQVHLYDLATGALCCIMDAQHLTTLRTGATSAVATKRLARPGAGRVALLGSGPEARAQLEAMAVAGYVASARVYSPTEANRIRLADAFRTRHGMAIEPAASAEAAVDGADMVLAAVKSSEPVLFGRWLRPGMHVNSVGTARRDQREIDVDVFTRSARIVVDTKEGVFGEAGDAYVAREAVDADAVRNLCELVAGEAMGRADDREITLFKSVGSGIQDIALAATIYDKARARGLGRDIGTFPYLKGQA